MDTYKICGAKTRKGTYCQNTRLYPNGRCKNHGGLATGPRTIEGRLKVLKGLKYLRDLPDEVLLLRYILPIPPKEKPWYRKRTRES